MAFLRLWLPSCQISSFFGALTLEERSCHVVSGPMEESTRNGTCLWSTGSEGLSTASSHVRWSKITAALDVILLAALWETLEPEKQLSLDSWSSGDIIYVCGFNPLSFNVIFFFLQSYRKLIQISLCGVFLQIDLRLALIPMQI